MKKVFVHILYICFFISLFVFVGCVNLDNGQINESKAEVVIVTHIVDGDTFDIANGERIRLIGINAPEKGEYFFVEAKKHLGELIDGKKVILKKDVSETDRYGRLLRHVYYNDMWINKKMIEDGFARAVTIPPDVAHTRIFSEAQKHAREKKLGIWAR